MQPDLTLPGRPEVFVIGDMMSLDRLPGVAQVAIQGGKYAAKKIIGELTGSPVTVVRAPDPVPDPVTLEVPWLEAEAANGAASRAGGTRVVLPAPGGASSTRRGCSDRLRTMSGSRGVMGNVEDGMRWEG